MHRKLITHIALLGLLLILGCSQEESNLLSTNTKALKVDISLPDETIEHIKTRSSKTDKGEAYENQINNLAAFLFDIESERLVGFIPANRIVQKSNHMLFYITEELEQNLINQDLLLTVVANSKSSDWSSIKSYSDLYELTTTDDFNAKVPPTSFLMTGSVKTGKIRWDATNSLTYSITESLKLNRAAAKICAYIEEIAVKEGDVKYEMVGKPELRLVNYAPTTTILKAPKVNSFEARSTDFFPLTERYIEGKSVQTTEFPFYSYELDWSTPSSDSNPYDSEREPYLQLKLYFKAGDLPARPYFYRIPINYTYPMKDMTATELEGLYKLQRNHFYSVYTKVHKLGSEDENTPIDLESKIAIQPYTWIEDIDGSIYHLDYLTVKEHNVVMPNINKYLIEYQSSAPIQISIDKVEYIEYKTDGTFNQVIKTNAQEIQNMGIRVTDTSLEELIYDIPVQKNYIQISSPIPQNNVPLTIKFTVKHKNGSPSLYEEVIAIQYPDKYVTGKKSTAFINSYDKTKKVIYDFRFHDRLGRVGATNVPQINNTLYKVKILVPSNGEKVGVNIHNNKSNTLTYGYTKDDPQTNEIISPEFIIASQHGMSQYLKQEAKSNMKWNSIRKGNSGKLFIKGYGPVAGYKDKNPVAMTVYATGTHYVFNNKQFLTNETIYEGDYSAKERCYNYFEDEYGTDDVYIEHFIHNPTGNRNQRGSRRVQKKFKHQGRWRLPTVAELRYIRKLQEKQGSAVKKLLQGDIYWTAQKGYAYSFKEDKVFKPRDEKAFVRCVFDTWRANN